MEREYSSVHVDNIKYNIRTEVYIDSILFYGKNILTLAMC